MNLSGLLRHISIFIALSLPLEFLQLYFVICRSLRCMLGFTAVLACAASPVPPLAISWHSRLPLRVPIVVFKQSGRAKKTRQK